MLNSSIRSSKHWSFAMQIDTEVVDIGDIIDPFTYQSN
jgi:hypothetical protein